MKRAFVYLAASLCFWLIAVSCGKNSLEKSQPEVDKNLPHETYPIEYTIPPNNPQTTQEIMPEPLPVPTPPPEPQRVLLSTYETRLLAKDTNRTENIKLASSKINGLKIDPGKIFSFNQVVGRRTSQRGFKEATAIINDKYEDAIGGGICQLSSTLFNAAEKAGLSITERHSHSKQVAYVPKGRDATVVYGSLDFKFRNTKDFTIELETRVQNGKVTTSIYKVK